MTEHTCKTSKDFDRSLEFHRDLSAMMKQELERLRAENSAMRKTLEYYGSSSHTAHLARQWELMEKVIREARYFQMNQNVGNALKALDEHVAKGKE